MSSPNLGYIIQFVFAIIAVVVPLRWNHKFFKVQYGTYSLLVISICSVIGSILSLWLNGTDVSTTFTRIFLIAGVGTSVVLFNEIFTQVTQVRTSAETFRKLFENILKDKEGETK